MRAVTCGREYWKVVDISTPKQTTIANCTNPDAARLVTVALNELAARLITMDRKRCDP